MSILSASSPTKNPDIRRNPRLGYILGLIGVIIFSGTLPATKVAIVHFDPIFLTFSRALLASLAAGLLLLALKKPFPRPHLLPLLFIGFTLVYAFPGFMALAMMTVPSSHGGVVLGILPLLTAIFAVLIAGERPSVLFWTCGILGTLVIIVFSLSYDFPWVSCEVCVEASHAIYGVTGFDGRWIVRGLVVMNRLIV